MEHRIIDISLLDPNEGQIDGLPSNPRKWSGDDLSRLEDSIRETPELLEARGIIVVPSDGRYVVLGGNMRLAAIRGLGRTEAPCIVLPESTPCLMDATREGDVVLDAFGGSGTTLIACEQLNRKCRMMELDTHYCDVIMARWEKLTGRKAVKIS